MLRVRHTLGDWGKPRGGVLRRVLAVVGHKVGMVWCRTGLAELVARFETRLRRPRDLFGLGSFANEPPQYLCDLREPALEYHCADNNLAVEDCEIRRVARLDPARLPSWTQELGRIGRCDPQCLGHRNSELLYAVPDCRCHIDCRACERSGRDPEGRAAQSACNLRGSLLRLGELIEWRRQDRLFGSVYGRLAAL